MKKIKNITLSLLPFASLLAEGADPIALAKAQAGSGTFAPLGAGLVVLGAGIGIGLFASAAAKSIARQPEAVKDITGAVNLPLFLLEGVAIIALVVCLLATF